MKNLYLKYREVIDYLIWGFAAWALYMILIWIFTERLGWNATLSTVLDNILVINFAFFTNKLFVFRSKTESFRAFGKEYVSFAVARLSTLILSTLLVWIFSDMLGYDSNSFRLFSFVSDGMIVQLSTQAIVIITNYILSKLIVFRNKKG